MVGSDEEIPERLRKARAKNTSGFALWVGAEDSHMKSIEFKGIIAQTARSLSR